jgi:hypothetical protein
MVRGRNLSGAFHLVAPGEAALQLRARAFSGQQISLFMSTATGQRSSCMRNIAIALPNGKKWCITSACPNRR